MMSSELCEILHLLPDDVSTCEPAHQISETLRNEQILYEAQKFSDVVLIAGVDGTKIPAHRVMLSAWSEYFSVMFCGTMKEASSSEVTMEQADGASLKAIVDFMYFGFIELTNETVETALQLADLLQLHVVVDACCEYMLKQLDSSNCVGMLILGKRHGLTEFHSQCLKFVCTHFNEVYTGEEFLELSEKDLDELLSCDDLCVPSEEQIFRSLLAWTEYDPARRASFLRLLPQVRYQFLKPEFIDEQKGLEFAKQRIIELQKYPRHPLEKAMHRRLAGKIELIVVRTYGERCLKLQSYNLATDEWSIIDLPRPPTWREYLYSFTCVNSKLILAGGAVELSGLVTNMECLDFKTNEWTTLSPMPATRDSFCVAELNGDLYFVGGDTASKWNWARKPSVHKYNVRTDRWEKVTGLRKKLSWGSKLAALHGLLYAFDGENGTLYSFDPRTNAWTQRASRGESSQMFGVASGNGHLFTVGGLVKNKLSDTVERYDPKTDSWTALQSLEFGSLNMKCFVIGEHLIACGGNDVDRCFALVQIYSPFTNKWKDLTLLPLHRGHTLHPIMRT